MSEKDRLRIKALRTRRRSEGKCFDCEELALPGKTRCSKHIRIDAERSRKKRYKYMEENKCMHCGKPREEDEFIRRKYMCDRCAVIEEELKRLR